MRLANYIDKGEVLLMSEIIYDDHEHDHSHGSKIEVILFLTGLGALLIPLLMGEGTWKCILYIASMRLSGYHMMMEGYLDRFQQSRKTNKLMANIQIIMRLAAVGAVIIGEYIEAALLILIFGGAHFLEHYAEDKSNKEITNLIKINPTTARRLNENGKTEIVDVADLKVGDKLSVLNGDQIPTDGDVISGDRKSTRL